MGTGRDLSPFVPLSPNASQQGSIGRLSLPQAEALRKFSKDTERSEGSRDANRRLESRQSLASAKEALGPRRLAVVDLVIIRGRSLTALSKASGQTVDALSNLLSDAANTLADHYQSQEAA